MLHQLKPKDFHRIRPAQQEIAEGVASRDRNSLYLTSCLFHDSKRYDAFCAQYAVMRVIDDQVDSIPIAGDTPEPAAARESAAMLRAWRRTYRTVRLGDDASADPLVSFGTEAAALAVTLRLSLARFPVPDILWRRFFQAMQRDIRTRRFATYRQFQRYCEGASCSPTTIYLYLLASNPNADGVYVVPDEFPLIAAGRRLGRFAYLGHILRDLAEDTRQGLVYLAEQDLVRHGLTPDALSLDAERARSSSRLRAVVREISMRARTELVKARKLLAPHWETLAPDCSAILRLIIRIYERVLDRIDSRDGEVMDGRHRLTSLDQQELISTALEECA